MLPMKRTQSWLPSIFSDLFEAENIARFNSFSPAINIIEHEKEYELEVAAPGMTKEYLSIKVNDENELVISMEKKEEHKGEKNKGKYLRRDFSYTHFRQTILLPDGIANEKIDAKMDNGMLHITIPKDLTATKKSKEITIQVK
jgi:HSP20 family protein